MAYVQKNNPFPVTSCGRRRNAASEGSPMKRTKPHTSWTQSDRDEYRRENPDKNGDCPNDIARRKWKC